MYSVRSGPPTRGRTSRSISVPDSPLATSSNASSEVSVSNNVVCIDGSEIDEDISSDKGARSPASVRGRWWLAFICMILSMFWIGASFRVLAPEYDCFPGRTDWFVSPDYVKIDALSSCILNHCIISPVNANSSFLFMNNVTYMRLECLNILWWEMWHIWHFSFLEHLIYFSNR